MRAVAFILLLSFLIVLFDFFAKQYFHYVGTVKAAMEAGANHDPVTFHSYVNTDALIKSIVEREYDLYTSSLTQDCVSIERIQSHLAALTPALRDLTSGWTANSYHIQLTQYLDNGHWTPSRTGQLFKYSPLTDGQTSITEFNVITLSSTKAQVDVTLNHPSLQRPFVLPIILTKEDQWRITAAPSLVDYLIAISKQPLTKL